jgi:putative endonuclease
VRDTQQLGRYGEDVAVRHLQECGLVVLERNWRCDIGEIDIVAREGSVLVVCEVKTRRGLGYGAPVEAVTGRKLRRMRRLAVRWLDEHQSHVPEIRFDIVGITRPATGPAVIEHLKGVA